MSPELKQRAHPALTKALLSQYEFALTKMRSAMRSVVWIRLRRGACEQHGILQLHTNYSAKSRLSLVLISLD